MHRTIEFWQITHFDHTPLTTNFPAEAFQQQIIDAKAANMSLEATTADGTPVWVIPHRPDRRRPPFLTLYKPRRENQSHLSDHGEIRNLPFTDEQFITEPTYFCFFERNIVGVLYYFESPRPGKLIEYINIKFGARLGLVPIYSRDLNRMLNEMAASYLELTIPSAQAAQLGAEVGGQFAAPLRAVSQLLHDGSITLKLSVGRRGDQRARRQRRESLVQLARTVVGNRGIFESARLVGSTGDRDGFPIDLLQERFAHKVLVPPAPFVPGVQSIRDDTGVIRDQYAFDRNFLEGATTPILGMQPDPGLLGPFRERQEGILNAHDAAAG